MCVVGVSHRFFESVRAVGMYLLHSVSATCTFLGCSVHVYQLHQVGLVARINDIFLYVGNEVIMTILLLYIIGGPLVAYQIGAFDRQLKDLGSNPSAVESVFFSTERFFKFFNI